MLALERRDLRQCLPRQRQPTGCPDGLRQARRNRIGLRRDPAGAGDARVGLGRGFAELDQRASDVEQQRAQRQARSKLETEKLTSRSFWLPRVLIRIERMMRCESAFSIR